MEVPTNKNGKNGNADVKIKQKYWRQPNMYN